MNCFSNETTASLPEEGFSFSATSFILPGIAVMLLLILIREQSESSKGKKKPPQVPGLPFLGSAIDFQSRPVEFLHDCRKTYGDIFSLKLPFHRMHVIMDIHSLDAFSKHRHFDFEPIQKMVNRNVFSFALPDARNMMREVTRHTKKSQLVEVVDRYSVYVDECLDDLAQSAASEWTQRPLRPMLLSTQFRALFNTIFGRSDAFAFNAAVVSDGLDRFHKAFNFLWLGFPCWLFPDPNAALKGMVEAHPEPEELMAREDASAYIRSAMAKLKEVGGDRNIVIGHNLVYTHVNYNSINVTYWALVHLAANPEAQAELLQEAKQLIEAGSADGDAMAEVQLDDILRLPILDSVLKETFRISSGVLMVREVTQDTTYQPRDGPAVHLSAGEKVAMYPPAIHLDPEIFESPYEFRYDRFIDAEFFKDGMRVAKPLLPYGTLCPGQQMSMAQVKVFIFSFVTSFEFRFQGEVPQYNRESYGHEILPVLKDQPLSLRERPGRRRLRLRFV